MNTERHFKCNIFLKYSNIVNPQPSVTGYTVNATSSTHFQDNVLYALKY